MGFRPGLKVHITQSSCLKNVAAQQVSVSLNLESKFVDH
jgi:hypothetical protein